MLLLPFFLSTHPSVCLNTAVLPLCAPMLFGFYSNKSLIQEALDRRPFEDFVIDTGCSESVAYSPADYKPPKWKPRPSLRLQYNLWKVYLLECVTLIVPL